MKLRTQKLVAALAFGVAIWAMATSFRAHPYDLEEIKHEEDLCRASVAMTNNPQIAEIGMLGMQRYCPMRAE